MRLLISLMQIWSSLKNGFRNQLKKKNVSLKATTRIKELNEMMNNDLECANCRKKVAIPDDESEQKKMKVFKDKQVSIEAIFHQWSQEEIRLYYQETW